MPRQLEDVSKVSGKLSGILSSVIKNVPWHMLSLFCSIAVMPKTRFRKLSSTLSRQPFAVVGLLLVINKLLEMLPTRDLGIALKLLPLIIVGLLFVLIKENPFRINTELVMER